METKLTITNRPLNVGKINSYELERFLVSRMERAHRDYEIDNYNRLGESLVYLTNIGDS